MQVGGAKNAAQPLLRGEGLGTGGACLDVGLELGGTHRVQLAVE